MVGLQHHARKWPPPDDLAAAVKWLAHTPRLLDEVTEGSGFALSGPALRLEGSPRRIVNGRAQARQSASLPQYGVSLDLLDDLSHRRFGYAS